MQPFIKESTLEWPIYQPEIEAEHPNVSFDQPFDPSDKGYKPIATAGEPIYDRIYDGIRLLDPVPRSGNWIREYEVYPLSPEEVEINLKAERDRAKEAAGLKKWELETQGIVLPGGARVETTIASQNRITSAVVGAEKAGITTVDFRADSGWVTLSLAEIEGVMALIGVRVQQLYTAWRAHEELIDTFTEVAQFDDYMQNGVHLNWPEAPTEEP